MEMYLKEAYVYFKENSCYKIESLGGKKSFDYYEFYKRIRENYGL